MHRKARGLLAAAVANLDIDMTGPRGVLHAHQEVQPPALREAQVHQAQYSHLESHPMRQVHRRPACPFVRVPQLELLAMVLQPSAKR